MNCLVCGEPVAAMTGTKLQNGRICKKCTAQLPTLLIKGTPYLQEYALRNAMNATTRNMERFNATASFGELHIDEMHGLFCIAQALDSSGKPKTGSNVFSMYDLTDIGLFCKSPRVVNNGVVVDVEFRCQLESLRLPISVIVKKNCKCSTKRVDAKNVEWEEPNDMAMFRTLFNRMLSGVCEKVCEVLCGKTVHAFELEKARAIFMLPKDYNLEDLKKARRLMMKVYHPDKAEDDVTREAQIINESYDLLRAELEYIERGTRR